MKKILLMLILALCIGCQKEGIDDIQLIDQFEEFVAQNVPEATEATLSSKTVCAWTGTVYGGFGRVRQYVFQSAGVCYNYFVGGDDGDFMFAVWKDGVLTQMTDPSNKATVEVIINLDHETLMPRGGWDLFHYNETGIPPFGGQTPDDITSGRDGGVWTFDANKKYILGVHRRANGVDVEYDYTPGFVTIGPFLEDTIIDITY